MILSQAIILSNFGYTYVHLNCDQDESLYSKYQWSSDKIIQENNDYRMEYILYVNIRNFGG